MLQKVQIFRGLRSGSEVVKPSTILYRCDLVVFLAVLHTRDRNLFRACVCFVTVKVQLLGRKVATIAAMLIGGLASI